MKKHTPKHVPLPSKAQVLEFILESPGKVGKREIARAFNLDAQQRPLLRQIMKDLEQEGSIQRGHKRRVHKPGLLPEVAVLEITATDSDGELLARPLNWQPDDPALKDMPPPRIYVLPVRNGIKAVGIGDKVLARLQPTGEHTYDARVIKALASAPTRVLGILDTGVNGLLLRPTDKRDKQDYLIARGDAGTANPGDLVEAELLPGRRFGLRQATVVENLGSMGNPKAVSLVAIHTHGIPYQFSQDALEQAEGAQGVTELGDRVDLRGIPLVTIDGSDARDFDDAVWAEATADGGWHCLVAIADVAHYVRTDDALDRTAYERGNSVYFPDRVVPMLPEKLSNGWCSLRPDEDRPCMAVHFWIDAQGTKIRHQFVRGLMRSVARLTYEQVQAAIEGTPDLAVAPLVDRIINPLYGAFKALRNARDQRGALEIEIPERKVLIGDNGEVLGIVPRLSLDAHKLIEEFMVTANVCAAETLEQHHQPCMYRVHDEPSLERVDSLREFLQSLNLNLAHGALRPQNFNFILAKVKGTEHEHLVNQVVLRTQAQAIYGPENRGHFGLGLQRYAHFTSPIRRYADLLVHRALIRAMKFGPGGLQDEQGNEMEAIGEHISMTERRAASAEREAIERYTTQFLADRVGATFNGRISGATRFGLFVDLDETGASGLVPISTLPDDFYVHDEARHALVGRKGRREFQVGQRVTVVLRQADPVTGGMLFELVPSGTLRPAARPPKSSPFDFSYADDEDGAERPSSLGRKPRSDREAEQEGPRKHFTPLRVGGVKNKAFNKTSGKKVERAGKKRVVRFEPGTTGRRKKDAPGSDD